ncbi:MAG: metallopeptidase family protein [Acidobacteriia bacterium]|nr:metallopeptidase family protein [Terriglobia bacterium]
MTNMRGCGKKALAVRCAKVERDRFVRLVAEVLDALPAEFRKRMHNLAILVEDEPPRRLRRMHRGTTGNPGSGKTRRLVLGVFQGVPATRRSVFDLSIGPDHIVLYQKNIEAVCSNETEIRHEVRQTVLHELGHYFGMNEAQLKDV